MAKTAVPPAPSPVPSAAIDAREVVRLCAAADLPAGLASDVILEARSMPDAIRRIQEAVTARTAGARRETQIKAYVASCGPEYADLEPVLLRSGLSARDAGQILTVVTGLVDRLESNQIDGSLSPDDMTGKPSEASIARGWKAAFRKAKDAVTDSLRGGTRT